MYNGNFALWEVVLFSEGPLWGSSVKWLDLKVQTTTFKESLDTSRGCYLNLLKEDSFSIVDTTVGPKVRGSTVNTSITSYLEILLFHYFYAPQWWFLWMFHFVAFRSWRRGVDSWLLVVWWNDLASVSQSSASIWKPQGMFTVSKDWPANWP